MAPQTHPLTIIYTRQSQFNAKQWDSKPHSGKNLDQRWVFKLKFFWKVEQKLRNSKWGQNYKVFLLVAGFFCSDEDKTKKQPKLSPKPLCDVLHASYQQYLQSGKVLAFDVKRSV